MKITKGRIVEASEKELRDYWFRQDMYYICTFGEYCEAMKNCGVNILDWKARPPTE